MSLVSEEQKKASEIMRELNRILLEFSNFLAENFTGEIDLEIIGHSFINDDNLTFDERFEYHESTAFGILQEVFNILSENLIGDSKTKSIEIWAIINDNNFDEMMWEE